MLTTGTPADSVRALTERAVQLLNAQQPAPALEAAIEAKATKVPLEGLDYVRAVCFVQLQRLGEAKEALKEELRFFPSNNVARELLVQVEQATGGSRQASLGDDEFRTLWQAISPYTMLSDERLWNLFSHARELCKLDVPGNFVECGVAAGGSSALLAYVIKRYSKQPRLLFSLDSFSGMPKAGPEDAHHGTAADATGWGTGTCAAPIDSLMKVASAVGADDIVRPIKGYFEDTIPEHGRSFGAITLLHMDGDWYSSTKVVIEALYPQMIPGGLIQVDDYGYWEGCRKAITEYETKIGRTFEKTRIDDTGVWFRRPSIA